MDPAFVLIHGGGLESWVWERVTPLLDLPAISTHRLPPGANWKTLRLEDCARFVEHQIAEAGISQAIVVAHSISGVIAHELVVIASQRIAGMVFLSAVIPIPGKPSLSALPFGMRTELTIGQWLAKWDLTPTKAVQQYIAEKLCHDLDEAATRDMLERGTNPEPIALFFQPTSRLPLPDVPCTYVKLTNDRALHPTVQDQMAARIHAPVVEIASGHTVMLSRPKELADALNRFAHTILTSES
jgi:pimeloyl-ACP methyl ester carboxylesterase